MEPRLELRREHEIHEDQRQRESLKERAGSAIELARASGERKAVLGTKSKLRCGREHLLLRAGLRRAREHVCRQRDLALTIEATDIRGRSAVRERGDVVQ